MPTRPGADRTGDHVGALCRRARDDLLAPYRPVEQCGPLSDRHQHWQLRSAGRPCRWRRTGPCYERIAATLTTPSMIVGEGVIGRAFPDRFFMEPDARKCRRRCLKSRGRCCHGIRGHSSVQSPESSKDCRSGSTTQAHFSPSSSAIRTVKRYRGVWATRAE